MLLNHNSTGHLKKDIQSHHYVEVGMTVFVAEPGAEIIGQALLYFGSVLGMDDAALGPYLKKHGLDHLVPDQWYPHQACLDLLKELDELDYFHGIALGVNAIAIFSPPQPSMEIAFQSMDISYFRAHRGVSSGYRYEMTGPRSAKVICNNPYPSDFDYAIVYSTVKNSLPADSTTFTVVRDDSVQNRTNGGDTDVFLVAW